jgi:hypothetical protein
MNASSRSCGLCAVTCSAMAAAADDKDEDRAPLKAAVPCAASTSPSANSARSRPPPPTRWRSRRSFGRRRRRATRARSRAPRSCRRSPPPVATGDGQARPAPTRRRAGGAGRGRPPEVLEAATAALQASWRSKAATSSSTAPQRCAGAGPARPPFSQEFCARVRGNQHRPQLGGRRRRDAGRRRELQEGAGHVPAAALPARAEDARHDPRRHAARPRQLRWCANRWRRPPACSSIRSSRSTACTRRATCRNRRLMLGDTAPPAVIRKGDIVTVVLTERPRQGHRARDGQPRCAARRPHHPHQPAIALAWSASCTGPASSSCRSEEHAP